MWLSYTVRFPGAWPLLGVHPWPVVSTSAVSVRFSQLTRLRRTALPPISPSLTMFCTLQKRSVNTVSCMSQPRLMSRAEHSAAAGHPELVDPNGAWTDEASPMHTVRMLESHSCSAPMRLWSSEALARP